MYYPLFQNFKVASFFAYFFCGKKSNSLAARATHNRTVDIEIVRIFATL